VRPIFEGFASLACRSMPAKETRTEALAAALKIVLLLSGLTGMGLLLTYLVSSFG